MIWGESIEKSKWEYFNILVFDCNIMILTKGAYIMQERIFHVLMQELCSEMEIKMEILSYGWILQLSKDGKVRHIAGNRFDIYQRRAKR